MQAQGPALGSANSFELGVPTTRNRIHAEAENTDSSIHFDLAYNTNQPDAVFCLRLVQTHCMVVASNDT